MGGVRQATHVGKERSPPPLFHFAPELLYYARSTAQYLMGRQIFIYFMAMGVKKSVYVIP
jgi:hypothetical protein